MRRRSVRLQKRESQFEKQKANDGHYCILRTRPGNGENRVCYCISTNGAVIGTDPSLSFDTLNDDDNSESTGPMGLLLSRDVSMNKRHFSVVWKNGNFVLKALEDSELKWGHTTPGSGSHTKPAQDANEIDSADGAGAGTDQACRDTSRPTSTKAGDEDCDVNMSAENGIISDGHLHGNGVVLSDRDIIIAGANEFIVSLISPEQAADCKRPSMACYFEPNFRWRDSMEDRCFLEPQWINDISLLGIFDGHAGSIVADLASSILPHHIRNSLRSNPSMDIVDAIVDGFQATNTDIGGLGDMGMFSGCTVVTAALTSSSARNSGSPARLVVANVGDSQAVLSRNGKAIQLSSVHKATVVSERQRVCLCGGCITNDRLMGLSVTRALGDLALTQFGLSAGPSICDIVIEKDDEFVILATDGLWDTMSLQEAIDLVHGQTDAQTMSRILVEEAINRNSRDNVSVAVLVL